MTEREVLIGVAGGIAAYKTAALVSQLVQRSIGVSVIMTKSATAFVGEATLAALTGRPVAIDLFDPQRFPLGPHIELARRARVFCIAPATAQTLAALAQGHADELLAATYLCFDGPVILAPAMNREMWAKPSVQRNVQLLQSDGVQCIGPESGWQSCREQGTGRMSEPEVILAAIEARLPAE